MISTKLTTINQDIQSCQFIPESVRALVQRRTAENKHFGKLEICAPLFNQYGDDEKEQPQRIIAGFLLDTSGSMDGIKLQYAVNTIRKFVEVIHEERNGKTIDTQPFHAWMYLITFNTKAELVIPFQEITEITIPKINERLDRIRADGSTNYEAAFEKQTQVLEEIIQTITEPTTILRFFETDGEITQGTMNIKKLYDMMRSTTTTTDTVAAPAPAATPRITFEDYVLGYGTDVDLVCLKALASRTPPPVPTATATLVAAAAAADSLSTLVTILKPEEIGWRVGEILSKFIMRYASTIKVSIGTTTTTTTAAAAAANAATAMNQGTIELFEYETHQWGHSTTIQTMMHGETRTLWVQYTPPPSSSQQPIPASAVAVRINIQYENRRTGEEFTATFEHSINPPSMTATAATAATDAIAYTPLFQKVIPLVLGMIQIEILKQYREIEADRYDMDTIVREAYKTKRMLNSIDGVSRLSFPNIACQTANLMTDVKVIIGLTTIQNFKEQKLVLHARRICSAEQELFNTGAAVSRKYVDFEENYEEEATRVIELRKQQQQHQDQDHGDNDDDDEENDYDDVMPSRIPTRPPVFDTPCPVTAGGRRHKMGGSILRALCVKIATARNNNEDISAEEIYDQYMRMTRAYYYDADCDAPRCHYDPNDDDTFSSTPMNDEYTQRRKGMMRQMSS